jgi:hypothetical protein
MARVRVLILGTYRNGGLEQLKGIRNALVESGISNCRLVSDFYLPPRLDGESNYELRKSIHWISQADLLLFVFIAGRDTGGPTIELKHALEDERAQDSIVAYCESESVSISSLIKQEVNMWSPAISQKYYQQEDRLVDLTYGNIISKLERVYYEILRRPPGDWEQSQPRDP